MTLDEAKRIIRDTAADIAENGDQAQVVPGLLAMAQTVVLNDLLGPELIL